MGTGLDVDTVAAAAAAAADLVPVVVGDGILVLPSTVHVAECFSTSFRGIEWLHMVHLMVRKSGAGLS